MFSTVSHCKIRRTSVHSEIKSTLKKNSVGSQCTYGILIGSRAARHYLPNFRGIRQDQHADWNILCSATFFLAWWDEHDECLKNMTMITSKSKDGSKLDLYINCIMREESNYNFLIPQSLLTYSAYVLDNSTGWIVKQSSWAKLIRKGNCLATASAKLLLILKKYLLYYTHQQWRQIANDYRELLTIAEPLTEEDRVLCDLMVQHNEKIYERQQTNDGQPTNMDREEFFQQKKSQRIELLYEMAMAKSCADDILVGFENICTQGPIWLADYLIDHWIFVQNEKFKQKFSPLYPCIELNVEHPCLFPQLPNNVTQRILHNISEIADFYAMQFVCKQWYALLHDEAFWKDLYISRYGTFTAITSWKMLYGMRMLRPFTDETNQLEELVNSSRDLRLTTGNDVLQLWEDLTHQVRRVDPIIVSRVDYILSNAFYYQMEETPNQFSVKLIVEGLKGGCSPSKLHIAVYMNEYCTSHFKDRIQDLFIEFQFREEPKYSLKFPGSNLLGFDLDCLGYISTESILFTASPSCVFPEFPLGLLVCLFIRMSHPSHRTKFITYLKSLESHCLENLAD